jgi:hypothetical protein
MNEDINNLQYKINNLYFEAFKNYIPFKIKGKEIGLSVPLLPKISSSYLENRVIVLGQETNTWYKSTNNDLKNIFLERPNNIKETCLDDRYHKFMKDSVAKYEGMFWKFNRELYVKRIIKSEMILDGTLSHVWLNLFAVEACEKKGDNNGRPTKNKIIREKIKDLQKDLNFKIFQELKPKLIIATTGHGLDDNFIRHALGNASVSKKAIDQNEILTKRELAEIIINDPNHVLFNIKIIRTYHPSYFMGRINKQVELKKKLKQKEIKLKVSEYYTKVLFDFLKEWING